MERASRINSILMIDDDRDDFELLLDAVNEVDANISVHFMQQCDSSLVDALKKNDLVFLDINMPKHDGFECLKGIREKGFRNPVIMYSNSKSPEHIEKAYRQGADLYFGKPESFTALIAALKKLVMLDWSNPPVIKESHRRGQKFATFSY